MKPGIFDPLLVRPKQPELDMGRIVEIDPPYGRALIRLSSYLTVWAGIVGRLAVEPDMEVMVARIQDQWVVMETLQVKPRKVGLAVI